MTALSFILPDGLPCLAPEIQLLYKSKNVRSKDQRDFEGVLPRLTQEQRSWLLTSLRTIYGDGHPWISNIKRAEGDL
jgi:hypothetical protein